MKNFLLSNVMLLLALAAIMYSCKSSKTTASRYVGVWHYSVEWDGTEYPMKMVINTSDNGYTGFFSSDWGDLQLDDLVIEDDQLTATYDFQGNLVDFKGTFEEDTFKGLSTSGGMEFPMEATRKNE